MAPDDIIVFWKASAEDDWETAEAIAVAKKYPQALFFLPIHELVKLAHQAALALTKQQEDQLKEITSWNINARYDDYKRVFYRKASKEFTIKWLASAKELFQWLKNQY